MIRDRIVVGILNQSLSEWLQLDVDLTLEKAKTMTLEKAKTMTLEKAKTMVCQ